MTVVTDDDRLARGARRGVQLDNLFKRKGEHSVRECLAQGAFVRKRQLANILERFDVAGLHAHLVHLVAIPLDALVGPCNLRDELLQLNSADALAGAALNIRVVDGQLIELARSGSGKGRTLFRNIDHRQNSFLPRVRRRQRSCSSNPLEQAARPAARQAAARRAQGLSRTGKYTWR